MWFIRVTEALQNHTLLNLAAVQRCKVHRLTLKWCGSGCQKSKTEHAGKFPHDPVGNKVSLSKQSVIIHSFHTLAPSKIECCLPRKNLKEYSGLSTS